MYVDIRLRDVLILVKVEERLPRKGKVVAEGRNK
jgi:hypothetical protein